MNRAEAEHRCTECGRHPRPDENAEDDRRAYSDGVGELLVFCAECAEREFGEDATAPGSARSDADD